MQQHFHSFNMFFTSSDKRFYKFPNFKPQNDGVRSCMLSPHISRGLTRDLIKRKQKCRMRERKITELFKIAVFIPGIWKLFIMNILNSTFY